MDHQSVKQSLERLRAALESGTPLDDKLKADLASLDADIHRLIDGQAPQAGSGLVERARELSLRFAERHPTAAMVLRELGTLLEGIGA